MGPKARIISGLAGLGRDILQSLAFQALALGLALAWSTWSGRATDLAPIACASVVLAWLAVNAMARGLNWLVNS